MKARIYKPTRNAMQSGEANTHHWGLVFTPVSSPFQDPLMGWTGSSDMPQEVALYFQTKEEAIAYAEKNGIEHEVLEPNPAKTLKPKSYASNFAYNRVQDGSA